MTNDDLNAMDFSKSVEIINRHIQELKEAEINHFLIAEITNAEGTYSKYTMGQWLGLTEEARKNSEEGKISELDSDLVKLHYGALVTIVYDIFAQIIKDSTGEDPDFGRVIAQMNYFHKEYLNNVQPQ